MERRPPQRKYKSGQKPAISKKVSVSRRRSKTRVKRIRGRRNLKDPAAGARTSLRHFRQATILAVAITGFFILLFDSTGASQEAAESPDTVAVIEEYALEDLVAAEEEVIVDSLDEEEVDATEAASEAVVAIQEMFEGFYRNLPKILVVIGVLIIVWLLVKLINTIIRKVIGKWDRTEAITTLVGITFWVLGIGVAISILAEDVRALIGSLGLLGLALSWALQSPIESFTGWLLNKFKGYYRIGDRIIVGDVIGDVYKIDFLNTTLWEIGDPFTAGFVGAEQPTGRLVTFPNNEIVNGVIINFTSDFPYVWDELATMVANESDISYSMKVIDKVASEIFESEMAVPADKYEKILRRARLEENIARKPQLYLSTQESGTNIIVRYLVNAKERRKWKTELIHKLAIEMSKPEHKGKIVTVYPRKQVQFLNDSGKPINLPENESKNP